MGRMSLAKTLSLGVTSLLLLLCIFTVIATLGSTRNHLSLQLRSHAQETAASLGLALGYAEAEADHLINAVFERGRYQSIRYLDPNGAVLAQRDLNPYPTEVPAWFTSLITLPAASEEAKVLRGTRTAGHVEVVPHPNHAYRDLWSIFLEQVTFTSMAMVGVLLLMAACMRFITPPLHQIEEGARAIAQGDFTRRIAPSRFRELDHAATAVNLMVERLERLFNDQAMLADALRREATTDTVTGLPNRREFDGQVLAMQAGEHATAPAALMLVSVRHFDRFNTKHGRREGDRLMRDLAMALQPITSRVPSAILARRSSTDFAIFLPGIGLEKARTELERCFRATVTCLLAHDPELDDGIHAGMGFSLRDVSLTSLLSRADMALRHAEAEEHNGYHFYVEDDRQDTVSLVIKQAESWRATLEHALEEDLFSFQYQPVMSASTGRPIQHEALVRLAVDGKLLRAGIFLPMAERFHMQAVLDRWIVSHLTAIAPTRLRTPVTINISGRSIEDEGFRTWLLDHLAGTVERARFVIELSEHALRPARDAVINLFQSLSELGVGTSIDHFGVGGVNFSYLEMLNLTQVRVHKSLIRELDRKGDQQFFLKSVVQVSRAANTRLIAEGIESAGEWRAVRRLGLDAGQGHFLAPPV